MKLAAVGLILFSSLLHAGWNLLLKQSDDKLGFSVAFLWAGTVLYLPLAVWDLLRSGGIPAGLWPILVLSAGLETGYWYLLAQAYRRGDMSQVYPLARGTGALSAAVLGVAVLGERLGAGAVAGLALVVVGGYVLGLPDFSPRAWAAPVRAAGSPAFRLAVLTGLCTGLYSLVDKTAVSRFADLPVLAYLWISYAGPAFLLTLLFGVRAPLRPWRAAPWKAVTAGLCSPLTYLLVLVAMTLSPVSRVAPVREITLVWGTLLGILVLKEQGRAPRLLGAVIIVAGVMALAFLR